MSDIITDLIDKLMEQLPENGNVRVTLTYLGDVGVPVAAWRQAARAAGRRLGRPVRTLKHDDGVVAYLNDWPATLEEKQRQRRQLRAAIEALPDAT